MLLQQGYEETRKGGVDLWFGHAPILTKPQEHPSISAG